MLVVLEKVEKQLHRKRACNRKWVFQLEGRKRLFPFQKELENKFSHCSLVLLVSILWKQLALQNL